MTDTLLEEQQLQYHKITKEIDRVIHQSYEKTPYHNSTSNKIENVNRLVNNQISSSKNIIKTPFVKQRLKQSQTCLKSLNTTKKKGITIILSILLVSLIFMPIITSMDEIETPSDITIINVYSYPSVGGTWTVMFTTIGQADLIITAVNGTTWSNNSNDYDLRLIGLQCCEENIDYRWRNESVIIENYSCDDIKPWHVCS